MGIEDLSNLAANLKYPETWITSTGLIALESATFTVASWMVGFSELTPWYKCLVIADSLIGTFVIWAVARPVYWKWGSGRKVGVSFETYKVPMEEWTETRRRFSRLCESFASEQKIHLKLLPSSMTETEDRMIKTQTRYKIPFSVRASLSPIKDKPDEPHLQVNFNAIFGEAISKEFFDQTAWHARELFKRPATPNLREMLEYKAAGLFEVTLLYLGIIDYTEKRLESAARFLDKLDECVSSRFQINQQPRMAIRWLHCVCLTSQSTFPGNLPPEPDELQRVTEVCRQTTLKYGAEFPYVYNVLSRDLFFLRDLDGALEAIRISRRSVDPEPLNNAIAILNEAVILLFLGNYDAAHRAFALFLSEPAHALLNWDDLLKFADYAARDGHSAAVFIKALYRKIANEAVPKVITSQLQKWVASDALRNQLGLLYHTYRTTQRTTEEHHLPARPKNQKTKQRENKNKKRK